MPFNNTTKLVEAIWAFVDQYDPGDPAVRSGFDQFLADLIAAINAQAVYTQSLIGAGADARYLGRKATVPTTRNDASALQAGDWYVSSAAPAGRVNLPYIYDGANFVVESDFSSVGATGAALVVAANQAAARGVLGLGSAAVQADTAFAPASVAADVALALKLAASGLAVAVPSGDWNNAHTLGTAFLQGTAAATNAPAAVNLSGFYVAYDANNGVLLLTAHSTGITYLRTRVGSTWSSTWDRLPRRNTTVASASIDATLSEPTGVDLIRIGASVTSLPTPAAEGDILLNSIQDANNAAQLLLTRSGSLLNRSRVSGVTSVWRRLQQSVSIVTKTAANVASLDFTEFDNAVFDWYTFRLIYVRPVTDATILRMRFSTNGGSSYDAGASDYNQAGTYMEDTVGPANDGGLLPGVALSSNGRSVGNAAGRLGVRGMVRLMNAGNGAAYTEVEFETTHESSSGLYTCTRAHAKRVIVQDTDAVRFLYSSGNINTGAIEMIGHRK